MKRTAYALLLTCCLLILAGTASAQVATGTPKFNSFGGGPFDTVNLGNLNVHFSIPILHKAGRIPFRYDLSYESSVWRPVTVSGVQYWMPAPNWGWKQSGQLGNITYTYTTQDCQYF